MSGVIVLYIVSKMALFETMGFKNQAKCVHKPPWGGFFQRIKKSPGINGKFMFGRGIFSGLTFD